jgi:hypothetical protein
MAELTYDDAVCCSCANSSCDRFEALLDIDNKASLNRRHIDPFSILIENLKASCVVLRQKGEKSSGVFVRTNALGVLHGGWVLDEFKSTHATPEAIKSLCWERQAFCHKA